MSTIGIDFGTTNSVVAIHGPRGAEALPIDTPPADWADMGFDRVLPTVFAVGPSGQPLFGWPAKTAAGEKLEAVKRLFRQEESVVVGGQTFVVEEVATMLFAHMRKMAAESGVDARQAVVTIPANSRGLARYRTKLCAGMSGIEVLALINEPTAAAMAYSATQPFDQQIMVVDWGGGTLDVTILQAESGVFIEQSSKGIQQLGGLDFDSRLAQAVLDRTPGADSWSAAERGAFRLAIEQAKIRLSTQEFTNVALPNGQYARVTRQMFEDAVRPLVERARGPIEQTLRDLSATPGDVDAVLLVGGTCSTPLVRSFVSEIMGRSPATGINPMTAVAEGAAIAAAILTGELDDNDFFVSTEHALGTYALDETRTDRFSTIIPRNHKLPAKATQTYFPMHEQQLSANVQVVEGDPDTLPSHEDNVVLKEWVVDLPMGRMDLGSRAFDITYEYDVDGILHVTVVDQLTGDILLADDIAFGVAKDKSTLVQISRRAQQTVESGQVQLTGGPGTAAGLDQHTTELLQRARTKVIPFLDESDAAPLKSLVSEVENASPATRASAMSRLETALRPFSYLF